MPIPGGTSVIPWPHARHPSLIYEVHPQFGYYVYSPTTNLWSQRRVTSGGREFILRVRGRAPTDDSLRRWSEIEQRLPELEQMAISAVSDPPIECKKVPFSRQQLSLRELVIGNEEFDLFFHSPTGDRIDMWPIVTFVNWQIITAEWAC